jgi:hypothetical protein
LSPNGLGYQSLCPASDSILDKCSLTERHGWRPHAVSPNDFSGDRQ